ncbi:helix-turn-helix domain-containing protein [Schaalia naturae]|jgi:Zn-dependent peptidase ImmA (M78 family)/DNA-binding XRE family transcriptional regulator|uniref:Helix-turn-helix domain-containing protein n=1 Tax=Schaalia naturae TaxID=635203 RepID=A0ABW2SIE2_9ACTO
MVDVTVEQLGARVRESRLRKGVTQEDLAERVSLERTVINKIEAGTRKIQALELSDIADALGVSMSSFFNDPSPAIVAHRSSQGIDTVDSQVDSVLESLVADVEFVQSLGELLGPQPQSSLDVPDNVDQAEDMATDIRRVLGLDASAPLTSITRRFANLGLFVFTKDLGSDTADAGTVLLQAGGVSLINSSGKVGRRRLAAAHELAHFLTADDYTVDWRIDARSGGPSIESRFDRFARALLLPSRAVVEQWNVDLVRFDVRTAAVLLASRYQVDMATLARRLTELDAASPSHAHQIREVRTTRGDMVEHDLHPTDELAGDSQPLAFQKAVLNLVRAERISNARALDLLWNQLSEEDLPKPRTRDANEIWKFAS